VGKNPYGPIRPNDRIARTKALRLSAKESAPVRERLRNYIGRTGLSTRDFAKRINYSLPALNAFLNNKYEEVSGSSARICHAITSFIEAHPITPPTKAFGELYETAPFSSCSPTLWPT
jgi:hypothetical protein